MADAENKAAEEFRILKHDIRNQLSNINIALAQLRYEIPEETPDIKFYMDMIAGSCSKITGLLKDGD